MAVVWPSKNNFANGDVLTAANMNNIADTLNVFNPTSATNGQVLTANGSGSASYQTPNAGSMTVLTSGNFASANVTYDGLTGYKWYRVVYYAFTPSSSTSFAFQIRISGTTQTAANYYTKTIYQNGTTVAATDLNTTMWATSVNNAVWGRVQVDLYPASGQAQYFSGFSKNATVGDQHYFQGTFDGTTAFTGIVLRSFNGTPTSGAYTIYGVN